MVHLGTIAFNLHMAWRTALFSPPLHDLAAFSRIFVDAAVGLLVVVLDGLVSVVRPHVSNICVLPLAYGGCALVLRQRISAWHCVFHAPAFRCHWEIFAALEAGTCARCHVENVLHVTFFPVTFSHLSSVLLLLTYHTFFIGYLHKPM